MLHIGFQHLADKLAAGADHTAQGAALPVDVLGGRIDDDIGALFDGFGKDRRGKHVVHDDQSPDLMGNFSDGPDIDQFQRWVGHRLEEHRLGARRHRVAPLFKVGAIDESDFDAVAGQNFLQHIKARPEEGAGGDDMIPRPQKCSQSAGDGGHPARGGESVLGALQSGDAFFEHPGGRVAITGVDEFVVTGLDKALFGGFSIGVNEALGEKDRFGHLAILAAAAAFMHKLRAGVPVFAHAPVSSVRRSADRESGGTCAAP